MDGKATEDRDSWPARGRTFLNGAWEWECIEGGRPRKQPRKPPCRSRRSSPCDSAFVPVYSVATAFVVLPPLKKKSRSSAPSARCARIRAGCCARIRMTGVIQRSALQRSALQRSALQRSALQRSASEHRTMRAATLEESTRLRSHRALSQPIHHQRRALRLRRQHAEIGRLLLGVIIVAREPDPVDDHRDDARDE